MIQIIYKNCVLSVGKISLARDYIILDADARKYNGWLTDKQTVLSGSPRLK